MKKIIYITLLMTLILSCKKDDVSEVFTTDLELVITNQFQTPIAGAEVFLFDNEADYNVVKNGGIKAYVASDITGNDGKVVFVGLDDSKKYYFHVKSGTSTNQQTDFRLKENLVKGAVTTAVIVLKSTESYLVFWTKQSNYNNLDIELKVNGAPVGDITGTRVTAPTGNDTLNALKVKVPAGKLTYKATGKAGCYWEGEVDLVEGQSKEIELQSCNTGSVVFFSKTQKDITVTLSQTNVVGTITSLTPSNGQTDCSNPNGLVVTRPVGTYLYKAVSDGCLWTGKVTITGRGCQKVEFTDCNQ